MQKKHDFIGLLWGVIAAGGALPITGGPALAGPTSRPVSSDSRTEADDAPDGVTTGSLVEQLGSPVFTARQRATRALLERGIAAKPDLVQALRHDDPEIRRRARQVLATVLDRDLQHRVTAFASDASGRTDHNLPGWRRFADVVGTDRVARSLYLEAVRAEPYLLEALDQEPEYVATAVRSRSQKLFNYTVRNPMFRTTNGRVPPPNGSITALLLCATADHVKLDDETGTKVYQLMQHSRFVQQLSNGPRREPIRRLVGLLIRRSAESSLAYQMLWLAMQHDLKEGLVPAEAIIQRAERQPFVLQNAILAVGRLGGREHIDLLVPLLDDDAAVDGRVVGKGFRPQVRDVALAVVVHLSDQQPADYGFTKIRTHRQTVFQANTMGFESDEQRDAALAKWRTWYAQRRSDTPETE